MKSVKGNLGAMVFKLTRWFIAPVALVLCLLPISSTYAQNIPPRPDPPRLVNDFAHIMSAEQAEELEAKLDNYSDSTTTQIAVVTVETLDGAEVGSYAAELGHKWGVGTKENLNGIVILMSKQERKATIRTGYGVEEKLGAIICDRIIQNDLVPNFKEGKFYEGFDAATTEIMQRLAGTYQEKEVKFKSKSTPVWIVIAIIIFVIFILPRFFGGGGGGTMGGGGFTGGMIGGFIGSGGFSGGGGGGDSGGFGGFGGGDFSGGGASGDW